ncbi:hypothetical protein CXF97_02295 [Pseudomonas sp. Choline-02u-1]|nr:hypothetical protein CXF97_02295 [Pseudomonas sp. Choline-02u-1]
MGIGASIRLGTDLRWERACSRMRCISRHQYCMTHRIREQARSHIWICGVAENRGRQTRPSFP